MNKIAEEFDELRDQLEYEIEDLAEFGMDEPIPLTKEDSKEIADLILKKDKGVQMFFDMDPNIVLLHRDDENYNWADFHNQLINVIRWHKADPLIKAFADEDYWDDFKIIIIV
ncbi:hypothetical protein [Bacillus toyonensis]|uniref:hypothetical protein n=1 Tax=Bacillus toyonensis TaxID=155322 RepID=UPI002E21199A|nr:hypothetical protein [Bacillus toyonensis]